MLLLSFKLIFIKSPVKEEIATVSVASVKVQVLSLERVLIYSSPVDWSTKVDLEAVMDNRGHHRFTNGPQIPRLVVECISTINTPESQYPAT